MNDQFNRSRQIQRQANAIVKKLQLNNFSKHGNFRVVGSLDYGLMTWRDIDIDLVLDQDPTDKVFWELSHYIFSIEGVKTLLLMDNRKGVEENRPKSMYIGVTYEDESNEKWKIDIRLLAQKYVVTDEISNLIKEKLDDESRLNILKIKSQVHDNPKYHKSFSSVDIYKAVLLDGVVNLLEFKKYLHKKGKTL